MIWTIHGQKSSDIFGPSESLESKKTSLFHGLIRLQVLAIAIIAAVPAASYASDSLRYPNDLKFEETSDKATSKSFVCQKPSEPMVDMSGITTFYQSGTTQSVIDKQKMDEYVKRNKSLQRETNMLRAMIETALRRPADRPVIGACIAQHLSTWAKAGALLKNVDDNTPGGQRQAILIGVFNTHTRVAAYALASEVGAITAEQKITIEGWFANLSDAFLAEFTPPTEPRPKSLQWLDDNSNTRYWAGSAVAMLAVQIKDEKKLLWASNILKEAISEFSDDGSLPKETARGERALHYQNFAMTALTNIAFITQANGVELTSYEQSKLADGATFTIDSFLDPTMLTARTGRIQEKKTSMIEWTLVLSQYFRDDNITISKKLHDVGLDHKVQNSDYIFAFTKI
jgi:hypothetical protein